MKAGRWDAPLALRDLAEAISEIWYLLITEKFFLELFRDGKYGLFLSQIFDGKMIFTDYWNVLRFELFGDEN